MEERPQNTSTPPQRNGRVLAFAIFVAVPAVIFWLGTFFVGVSLLALFADDYSCDVARVPLYGVLSTTDSGFAQLLGGAITSADAVVADIEFADEEEHVRAIVLDVDSPGGYPVAADTIMDALLAAEKPTVAVVRDLGASAAYWAAAGADYIIASPVSNVGSVGVTMSYLEFASTTDLEGARWVDLASGDFKDAGNPERALREEEEEHFRSQVDTVHEYMVDRIAQARGAISREELAELADGRSYVGTQALELKLVDELGGMDEALSYIANILNSEQDELTLCPPPSGGLDDLL
jgi:protease-4